jgi:hypothetical protein
MITYVYIYIHKYIYIYYIFSYESVYLLIHVGEYWILRCWFWRWYPSAFLGWFFNVFFSPPWEIYHWNPFRKWVCHSLSRDEVPQGPKGLNIFVRVGLYWNCHKLFNPQLIPWVLYVHTCISQHNDRPVKLINLSLFQNWILLVHLCFPSFWRVAIYIYISIYGLNKNTSTRAAGDETFACPTLETESRRCAGADFVNRETRQDMYSNVLYI